MTDSGLSYYVFGANRDEAWPLEPEIGGETEKRLDTVMLPFVPVYST